jgi:glycosyltransferase involved in cell wall biosynthesis
MSKLKVVHFYSDCQFFAGCESMLANFLASNELYLKYSIIFSYRYSKEYEDGFKKRIKKINGRFKVAPVYFPDLTHIFKFNQNSQYSPNNILNIVLRLLLAVPLGIYEIITFVRLFKESKPQILHINNGGYPGAFSARIVAISGKLAGVPHVIMVVNNFAIDYKNPVRWIDYPMDFLVKKSVDLFITASDAASKKLKEVLVLPAYQVNAVHNGIKLRPYSKAKSHIKNFFGLSDFNGVLLGVVALLVPRKGHIFLLRAILKLLTEGRLISSEFIFLIEGDGSSKKILIEFVKKNNLTKVVKFLPHQENIFDMMSLVDVLVLPSIKEEDFPNVILEAMALAKPIIATKIAGIPEQVIDKYNGYLVEPKDVEKLACAIENIVKNPYKRIKMGSLGFARFNENFTASKALTNYLNLYEELLLTNGNLR